MSHSNIKMEAALEPARFDVDKSVALHPIVASGEFWREHVGMIQAPAPLLDAPQSVARALAAYRFGFGHESELQSLIAEVLSQGGIEFRREVELGPGNRIDFLIDRVGLEIKTERSFPEALRQVDRYCRRPEVDAVVLATTRSWAPSYPGAVHDLRGKPVLVIRLDRSFA